MVFHKNLFNIPFTSKFALFLKKILIDDTPISILQSKYLPWNSMMVIVRNKSLPKFIDWIKSLEIFVVGC